LPGPHSFPTLSARLCTAESIILTSKIDVVRENA
jgi:hypothetical protein